MYSLTSHNLPISGQWKGVACMAGGGVLLWLMVRVDHALISDLPGRVAPYAFHTSFPLMWWLKWFMWTQTSPKPRPPSLSSLFLGRTLMYVLHCTVSFSTPLSLEQLEHCGYVIITFLCVTHNYCGADCTIKGRAYGTCGCIYCCCVLGGWRSS